MTDPAAPLRAPLAALMEDADFPRDLRAIAADGHDAVDFEAAMLRAGRAIIALEDHAKRAETLAVTLREKLLAVMLDTGCPSLSLGQHTVGYSEVRRVLVTDAKAVPSEYLDQPPPKPNTQAIGAALKAGKQVPGAMLSNAAPHLFVRPRGGKS